MARDNAMQIRYLEAKRFLDEVLGEVDSAQEKFPRPDMVLAALMEEVGELAQAVMERERAFIVKTSPTAWTRDNIRKEAIQVAAMALRLAVEGDLRFPSSQIND